MKAKRIRAIEELEYGMRLPYEELEEYNAILRNRDKREKLQESAFIVVIAAIVLILLRSKIK